jgi:copper(I)-binding protein
MRNSAVKAVLALLMLASCGHPQGAPGLGIVDAWVRLSPVPANPSAGYFTIQGGPQDNELVSVTSPSAQKIELHESMAMNGMMTMKPLSSVTVPAGKRVAFAPGGNHAMIFGLDPALKAGGTVKLTFHFKTGAEVALDAKLVGPADAEPKSSEHATH